MDCLATALQRSARCGQKKEEFHVDKQRDEIFGEHLDDVYRVAVSERFPAAKAAGFDAVECWFPYEHSIGALQAVLRENDLKLVGTNSAPGESGEWGLAALPGRQNGFQASVAMAIDYAQYLGVAGLHIMAGMTGSIRQTAAEAAYLQNLEWR